MPYWFMCYVIIFTPYMTVRSNVGIKILLNLFHISTLVDDSIVAKRVYRNCSIYVFL